MKKWGIILLIAGVLLIVSGLGFSESYREELGFMENIYRMEIVLNPGTPHHDPSNLNDPDTALYEGRVAIRCLHMEIAGVILANLGAGLWIISKALRKGGRGR